MRTPDSQRTEVSARSALSRGISQTIRTWRQRVWRVTGELDRGSVRRLHLWRRRKREHGP
jgi:hypothetical protein